MTLMAVALMEPSGQAVTIGGYFWNLLFVTIGNVIGGVIFVALPYYLASRKDE
jgi:nitrite transporter NirC